MNQTEIAAEGALRGQVDRIRQQMPSLTEQMRERKARLEAELGEVNSVLQRLEAMPEAAELLDYISRLGGLRY